LPNFAGLISDTRSKSWFDGSVGVNYWYAIGVRLLHLNDIPALEYGKARRAELYAVLE